MELIDAILHVDRYLQEFAQTHGPFMIYALLFAIIFIETGVVVMPFLPGDSLLFAAGALCATGIIDPLTLTALLWFAAVAGDNCNYWVGRFIGDKAYAWDSRWIRQKDLQRTHDFFARHGGKTIVIARFMPIVRTLAPFVAGIGQMHYPRYFIIDFFGGILWVGSFIFLGYQFGNLPVVKSNFTLVVFGIILLSITPAIVAGIKQLWLKYHAS